MNTLIAHYPCNMPALDSGKVLVTGANGYIAVWIVKSLLEAGFAVRGTVRSESKAAHLRSLFRSSGDKFETVVVPDITKVSRARPRFLLRGSAHSADAVPAG